MKLIATDYDGTLNFNGVDDKKRATVARWRKAGNLFGVISGRSWQSTIEQLNKDNIERDFVVGNNGASICNENGEIISETTVSFKVLKEFLEFIFQKGCDFGRVHCSNICFAVNAPNTEIKNGEYTLDDFPKTENFNQVSIQFETSEDSKEFAEIIKERFKGILYPLQNRRWIDVVPFGVSKSSGVYKLMEIFSVEKQNVITVGDSENDIDMLLQFNSYAMENGVEIVKKAAGRTVKDITEIIDNEI